MKGKTMRIPVILEHPIVLHKVNDGRTENTQTLDLNILFILLQVYCFLMFLMLNVIVWIVQAGISLWAVHRLCICLFFSTVFVIRFSNVQQLLAAFDVDFLNTLSESQLNIHILWQLSLVGIIYHNKYSYYLLSYPVVKICWFVY